MFKQYRTASVAAFVVAGFLAWGTAVLLVSLVERRTAEALRAAFIAGQMDWISASVDGLAVHLSGTAPDESARIRALRVAGEVIDASRLTDSIQVVSTEGLVAPVFRLEVMRSGADLSVIGLVPASGDGGPVVDQLLDVIPGAEISDMLQVADHAVPQGWVPAVAFALDALTRFQVGRLSLTSGRIEIEALVDSDEAGRTLAQELRAAAPRGMVLTLQLTAPRPVISPFLFRLERDAAGTLRLAACSADTDEAQARIAAALAEAGYARRPACALGLGAPSPRWAEAVARGIEALTALGQGSLVLSDSRVTLTAAHDAPAADFDRAVGRLETRLPEAFSLTAERAPAPDATPDATAGAAEFAAVLSAEGRLSLTGRLPDERIRDAVSAFARARFGSQGVDLGVRLDETLPTGWAVRVLTAIEALAELHNGRARVTADRLEVSGVSGNPDAETQVSQVIVEALGAGVPFALDVTYDEALDPVANAPTPDACEARIQGILAETKITFDPGSTAINASAGRVLDAIAEVFGECGELPFEVAGYTDSQGREETNLAISQARAEAVINGLLARRVLVSALVARGYGEADPVASNETEEGREANRRIEFNLIRPEPEPVPLDPALEAELVFEIQTPGEATIRPRPRPDRAAAGDAAGQAGGGN